MEIMMSFAEAILFIVVPQAEAWGFYDFLITSRKRKAAIAADEITNKVPRTPVSSIFICNMSIMRYD
ncbi:hypothetical protein ACTQ5P_02575 [Bacillota bacterium LCP21S3_G6]